MAWPYWVLINWVNPPLLYLYCLSTVIKVVLYLLIQVKQVSIDWSAGPFDIKEVLCEREIEAPFKLGLIWLDLLSFFSWISGLVTTRKQIRGENNKNCLNKLVLPENYSAIWRSPICSNCLPKPLISIQNLGLKLVKLKKLNTKIDK